MVGAAVDDKATSTTSQVCWNPRFRVGTHHCRPSAASTPSLETIQNVVGALEGAQQTKANGRKQLNTQAPVAEAHVMSMGHSGHLGRGSQGPDPGLAFPNPNSQLVASCTPEKEQLLGRHTAPEQGHPTSFSATFHTWQQVVGSSLKATLCCFVPEKSGSVKQA